MCVGVGGGGAREVLLGEGVGMIQLLLPQRPVAESGEGVGMIQLLLPQRPVAESGEGVGMIQLLLPQRPVAESGEGVGMIQLLLPQRPVAESGEGVGMIQLLLPQRPVAESDQLLAEGMDSPRQSCMKEEVPLVECSVGGVSHRHDTRYSRAALQHYA